MTDIPVSAAQLRMIVNRKSSTFKNPAVLSHVLYEPEKRRIVVSNGYLLALYPVVPDDGDVRAVIPIEAFDRAGITERRTDPYWLEVRENRVRTVGGAGERITEPYTDFPYPDYERAIDRAVRAARTLKGANWIALDVNYLAVIAKLLPKGCKGGLVMAFGDEDKSIVIMPTDRKDIRFLLSPIILNPYYRDEALTIPGTPLGATS